MPGLEHQSALKARGRAAAEHEANTSHPAGRQRRGRADGHVDESRAPQAAPDVEQRASRPPHRANRCEVRRSSHPPTLVLAELPQEVVDVARGEIPVDPVRVDERVDQVVPCRPFGQRFPERRGGFVRVEIGGTTRGRRRSPRRRPGAIPSVRAAVAKRASGECDTRKRGRRIARLRDFAWSPSFARKHPRKGNSRTRKARSTLAVPLRRPQGTAAAHGD